MLALKNIVSDVIRWLERQSRGTQLCIVLLWFVFSCVLDSQTGFIVNFGFMYVLTVVGASYFMGPAVGIGVAIACALTERFLLVPANFAAGVRVWNTIGRLITFGILISLVVQLKKAFRAEQDAARQDFLTGLMNRRAFEERAEGELERCRRKGCPLTILYIDCDNFKAVNDKYGHREGDRVLQKVADAMQANLRSTDVLARLGGDEFAALLPDSGESQARAAAEKLHQGLTKALNDSTHPVTCSLGAAVFAAVPDDVETMIHRADELMYRVKSSGRGAAQIDVFFER